MGLTITALGKIPTVIDVLDLMEMVSGILTNSDIGFSRKGHSRRVSVARNRSICV